MTSSKLTEVAVLCNVCKVIAIYMQYVPFVPQRALLIGACNKSYVRELIIVVCRVVRMYPLLHNVRRFYKKRRPPAHPTSHRHLRGVLGNKCAGQNNLKTVHFRETLALGNFLSWLSAICVFFCSSLSTLERRRQAFM